MRLCVVSDLHFEINGYVGKSRHIKEGGDVLIVAGDLTCTRFFNQERTDREAVKRRKDIIKLLENWADKFRRVYYVMGNHEHYGGVITESADIMRNVFKDTNVRLLEDEYEEFDGVFFYGATLWTSFNHADPHEMRLIQQMMNDYNWIKRKNPEELTYVERNNPDFHVSQGNLLPATVLDINNLSEARMKEFLRSNRDKRVVMITHHAPSFHCQNIGRYGTNLLHAYCNDYDMMLHQFENIELWCHGHTHDSTDFYINKTRIFSNQCGYVDYDYSARNFKPKFIEI